MEKKFRAADLMSTELYYDSYGSFEEMLNKVIKVEFPDDMELKSLSIEKIEQNIDFGYDLTYFVFKALFTKDGQDVPFILHDDSNEFTDMYSVFAEGNGKITISVWPDKGKEFPKDLKNIQEKYPVVKISY